MKQGKGEERTQDKIHDVKARRGEEEGEHPNTIVRRYLVQGVSRQLHVLRSAQKAALPFQGHVVPLLLDLRWSPPSTYDRMKVGVFYRSRGAPHRRLLLMPTPTAWERPRRWKGNNGLGMMEQVMAAGDGSIIDFNRAQLGDIMFVLPCLCNYVSCLSVGRAVCLFLFLSLPSSLSVSVSLALAFLLSLHLSLSLPHVLQLLILGLLCEPPGLHLRPLESLLLLLEPRLLLTPFPSKTPPARRRRYM